MTAYLLDSNHASALLDNRISVSTATFPHLEIMLPTTVTAELWFMVYNSRRIKENSSRLESFLKRFRDCPFDCESAQEFGFIKSELRQAGRPIPFPDIQIAAVARFYNMTLLTADKHFSYINGLYLENWL